MKTLLALLAVTAASLANAQSQEAAVQRGLYAKANTLFLPLGMLNAGLEFQLNRKVTVQTDVFISPWKSFMGKYAQIYMLGFDGRYYFREAFKHWYVGANFSAARYKMQKWNYWSDSPYQYEKTSPIYKTSDLYQDGFTFFLGAVVGYQWQLNEHWNLDAYLGGGTAQSFYKGFHKTLGVRYDTDPDRIYNRSGELVPYRGGLMLSYKLR